MKIEGTQTIAAPRRRVFAALIDPDVLQKCIPGCEQLEKSDGNKYNAKLSAGVGAIKGVFTATIALENINPPEHYTLVVEGKGQPGFVKGTGELNFVEAEGGTSVQYSAEVNIGGLLASVGQRMIQSAANMLAGKFFACLEAEAKVYEAKSSAS
jgi:carbon monoxide dehydrogenase subunit G